ncbi:uncharacterized protein LOC136082673 [Hydra vulgaris]|uniref:uncharacterized protein LOC136082673 n=1 Tax=Hydra vulgaris TaxID=6087 RepID=UPI0032EA3571
MFNENYDAERVVRQDEVLHLKNDVNALRRAENNHQRDERNRLRRDEVNRQQNVRRAVIRAEENLNPNLERFVRRVENNHRRNETNRLNRDVVNYLQKERNRFNRDIVNRRQNKRNGARPARMYSIARSNAIPDCNYLGEMNQICQYCCAKKFLDETHFLCCHNGKVALPPLSPFTQALQDLFTGSYVNRNVNDIFLKHIRNYNACNLRPDKDIPPKFSQLYIYDPLAAVNFRMQQRGNDLCLRGLMFQLQTIITEQSPFALAFKNMAKVEDEEIRQAALDGRSASVVKMSLLEGGDRRRYNLPSHDEVAVVFVGKDGALPTSREVIIYPRGRPLKIVSSMSANLDPMVYPLFFPRGDAGWHNQLVHNPERATLVRNHVTLSQFYNYRLSVRNNQNKLRSEQYDALHEHVNNIANDRNIEPGRVAVLPSSYVGSPRALKENFEDAMAIIKKYGKPDLFITFTCNSKWREITENLYPGQTANDKPDLVTRVFKLKLNNLLNDIFKHGVLDKVVTHVQVIEFHKRGLPHAHILLHLANDDKLETAQDINNLICAEIPDPIANCELYDIIKACMIHGPCGILNSNFPCMKDGVCSKNYPKEFSANTVAVHNGYPRYRRRDDGLVINIKGNNVDNRRVVPNYPWLSKKYQAHINVEACMSVKAVKYLYKYIYKGHDCANVLINEQVNHNKVNTFLDYRYVSAPEALWRIFECPISLMSHDIIRLKVYLPENQIVYFRKVEEQVALDRAAHRDTHLTVWFKLNSENEGAHRYSYVDIPYHFVLMINIVNGRLDKEVEIRLLLLQAKGAKSWEYLRTVNGIVLETFREACVLKGFHSTPVPFILVEQATLRQIETIINQSGKTLSDYNLPVVDEFIDFNLESLNDNVQQSIDEANRMRPLLNVNQLIVSNTVLAALNEQPSVENQHSRLFFMDGPAGSGKTFTYNYLIAETRSRGVVKSATAAWTGIAATLL